MYNHGKDTEIKVDGTVVKAKSSALNRVRVTHATSGYGDDDETHAGGQKNGTFTMSGVRDNTASTGNNAVLEAAWANADNDQGELVVIVYPEGSASGKPTLTFNTVMSGLDNSLPVDDMIQWTANFKVSGPVTVGTVAP